MALLSNEFSIDISSTAVPSWYSGQTERTWQAIGNTLSDIDPADNPVYNPNYPGQSPWHGTGGQIGVMNAWCGATYAEDRMIIAAQGGHASYAGNEVYEFMFMQENPEWVMRVPPSTSIQSLQPYFNDGKPNPRHGYRHDVYIPDSVIPGGLHFAPYGANIYDSAGGGTGRAFSFVPGSNSYDPEGTYADYTGKLKHECVTAFDSATGLVWIKDESVSFTPWSLWSFDITTNTYTEYPFSNWGGNGGGNWSGAIDPIRRLFLCISGNNWPTVQDLTDPGNSHRYLNGSINGTAPPTSPSGEGLVYHPPSQAFLVWNGGATVYKLTPGANPMVDDWQWSTVTNNAGGVTPTAADVNGTFGRFGWIEDLDALGVVNSITQQVYVYKLPAGGV